MKMKPEDYDKLKQKMVDILKMSSEAHAMYKQQGFTDRRFAWDVLWASGFNVCSLYEYLDDRHISTAILKIVSDYYKEESNGTRKLATNPS